LAIRNRWPLRIALIAVLLLAAPTILPIPVPLESAAPRIAAAASAASGYDVGIGGARLVTGLKPTLQLRRVSVVGAPALAAQIEQVDVEFLLLPLLAGEVRLIALEAAGVSAEVTPAALRGSAGPPAPDRSGLRVVGPGRVAIRRADATIHLDGRAEPLRIVVADAEASAAAGARTIVRARGKLYDLDAAVELETASPAELLGGAPTIPVKASVTLADASLRADGRWQRADAVFKARVSLAAPRAAPLAERLAGVALAPSESLSLDADLSVAAKRFAAERARIVLGESIAEGSAVFDTTGARPRFTFDAHAEVLDHRTLAERTQAGFALPAWLATWLALPRVADAHISLRVDRLLTPLVEVRNARYTATALDGVLNADGAATIDDVPLRYETRIDATGAAPKVQLRARATNVPLDQVAQRLGRPDVAAVAGKASFSLAAAGATAEALLAGFDLEFELDGLRVTERAPQRREVARVRKLRVEAAGTGESAVRADGTAWGERVTLSATTKELGALLGGRLSPVRFEVGIASARASGSGELSRGADGTRGRLRVEAGARPIGPLHNLLPVNPASALNAAVAAAVEFRDEGIVIDAATLRLGASAGRGRLALPAGKGGAPARVELALEKLDIGELQAALQTASAPRSAAAPPPDLSFDLAARKVRYRAQRVDDLRLSGELRGGRIAAAPFSAKAGGTRLAGTAGADLRQAEPRFDVDATAQPLDLGALLAWAGAPGPKGSAERATLKASLRGASAADLLRHASAELALERASLALPEYFQPKALDFSAQAKVAPGQPLTATLHGDAGGTAVDAAARLDGPGALLADAPASPFKLELRGASTSVHFSGTLAEARGRLTLEGSNPADLAPLLDLDPPDLGAYRAEADLAWTGTQLKAPHFAVKLGESSADGNFTVDWQGKRPRLKLALASPRVRLEDIGVKDPRREGAAAPPPAAQPAAPERATRLAAWRAFLRAYDGEVRIDAQRVESGGDLLGRGLYQERRRNGRVQVSPLLVEAEGARLTVTGDIEAAADGDPRYELRANLENFDLAALARREGPAGRGFGTLDARAQLTSRGLPDEFLVNASGEIEAMFIGEDLASGGLDLLTTSLLRIVSNTLHGERGSRVNCAVGDFVMTEGVLESKAFFIDTTRSRVAGDLRADLRTRELSGVLQPRAKRLQLFSVATPLTIGGTMESPQVTVSPVGVATGTLRLYLFAPTLALDWLNARGLPEDGTPACRDAFRQLAD
jgi:uncharacterized protein involved in outer membrane biogenesis